MEDQIIPPPPSLADVPKRRTSLARNIGIGITLVVVLGAGVFFGISHLRGNVSSATTTDPAKTGCPSTAAVPQWPQAANQTIISQQVGQTINASVGDIIEFDLATSIPNSNYHSRWNLDVPAAHNVQAMSPGGYANSAHTACVWRFKVTGAGQDILTFFRQVLCQSGQLCPPVMIEFRFPLQVQ